MYQIQTLNKISPVGLAELGEELLPPDLEGIASADGVGIFFGEAEIRPRGGEGQNREGGQTDADHREQQGQGPQPDGYLLHGVTSGLKDAVSSV